MATLRKIKGKYFAYFYDPSRTPARKSYPLRVSRKEAAQELLKRKEQEWAKGQFDPWNPTLGRVSAASVEEARAAFLLSKAHLRPNSRRAYDIALRGLCGPLPPGLGLADLTADHVRPYVESEEVSVETRHHRHRHLRAFFNWCRTEGLMDTSHDPLCDARLPRKGRRLTAFLSPAELERLLNLIDGHTELHRKGGRARAGENVWMKDVVLVAVGTGLRLGELCAMRWGWVDPDAGILSVRSSEAPGGFRTKSGSERAVPLAGDAAEVLARLRSEAARAGRLTDDAHVFTMPGGLPLRPDYVSKRFRFFVDEAKLPKAIHFHSLRHTTASWLTMRGVPLPVTQAILGHSAIQVTERYAHLAPDVMKAAMQRALGGPYTRGDLDPWGNGKAAGSKQGSITHRRQRLAKAGR